AGLLAPDDRHVRLPRQRDELGACEALVPDLDRMAQRPPTELARQQGEEGRDVVRVKPLGAHQLPEDRPRRSPNSSRPCAKNRSSDGPASASTLRLVT